LQNILEGVVRNQQLQALNLEWNVMRGSKVYQIASRVLKYNTTLTSLDMKHCGMTLESAYVMAKGLSCNATLHTLVLDGNPIEQSGARQMLVAASRLALKSSTCSGLEGKVTRTISVEGCSIAQRSKSAFDPSNPAGAYIMNCGLEYGQSVMLTVVEMVGEFLPALFVEHFASYYLLML
jgi:hypothetical protein